MMSPTARWSWKNLVFSAIIYCSAQKYGTSSTANDEGDHGGKQDGGCRNNTTLSVEYLREGSKAVLEFGPAMSPSGNTRAREHNANPNPWYLASGLFSLVGGKARESALTAPEKRKNRRCQPIGSLFGNLWVCDVPFWEHHSSALWACSVPLREHQASGARCESEPRVARLESSSLDGGNS